MEILITSCPEKKTSGIWAPSDKNFPLTESVISGSPVMCMPATWIGVLKPPVESRLRSTFTEKLLSAACTVMDKEKGDG